MLPFLKKNIKLLCDENIPVGFIIRAVELGFDVKKVSPGSSDAKVAMMAKKERRALLTFDKHFSNYLLYDPQKYAGIVVFRIDPPLVSLILKLWLNFIVAIENQELEGKLFIISPSGFRFFPKS